MRMAKDAASRKNINPAENGGRRSHFLGERSGEAAWASLVARHIRADSAGLPEGKYTFRCALSGLRFRSWPMRDVTKDRKHDRNPNGSIRAYYPDEVQFVLPHMNCGGQTEAGWTRERLAP